MVNPSKIRVGVYVIKNNFVRDHYVSIPNEINKTPELERVTRTISKIHTVKQIMRTTSRTHREGFTCQ
ncbi:unnamed protein product [Schistosoma margrebowiei]|uniref:Uncharacterized protein n=1 Tax=Schistosoma margrebowiei TaxID=48269 RepID=A0A183M2N6_9TREM|nr:unnamed protein product [Schistosoma margrebowiei]